MSKRVERNIKECLELFEEVLGHDYPNKDFLEEVEDYTVVLRLPRLAAKGLKELGSPEKATLSEMATVSIIKYFITTHSLSKPLALLPMIKVIDECSDRDLATEHN